MRDEAGAVAREELETLGSIEADLRAYRVFCSPHPLGRHVSRAIKQELDLALENVLAAREALASALGAPQALKLPASQGLEFALRDFDFLATVSARTTALAERAATVDLSEQSEQLAQALEIAEQALGTIDDFRLSFRDIYKYAEEIEAGQGSY